MPKVQSVLCFLAFPRMAAFFLLCFFSYSLQAQVDNSSKFGPSSQIRFSAMPALYNKQDYVNVGRPLYKSSAGVGGEFVVSYGQSLWKGFGISAGFGIGLVPYNYSFDLVTDSSSVIAGNPGTLGQKPSKNGVLLYTFPVLIEKKILLSPLDKLFLNLEAGIKWNINPNASHTFGGSYWAQTPGGEDVRYFQYRYTYATSETEFVSYVFKAGLLKVNNRGNSFSWNMVLQHSPATILTGTYQFNDLGFTSFGTTSLHNNYIGLEFIFGLTLDKKSNR